MFERFQQGVVEVVRSDAPLHAETVDSLRSVMDQLKSGGRRSVVMDLRKVPLVDSAGLEALLDLLDEFRARGGSLKLSAPNPLVREILAVTGVEQFFEIFGDEASAVGSFTR